MSKAQQWKQLDLERQESEAATKAHKGSYVGVVNFGLSDGYNEDQFVCDMAGLAPNFKPGALPGLLSKRWLTPGETARYGGVYLWEDGAQRALLAAQIKHSQRVYSV